ncbi:molybdopterin-dependent oxidoreductase [Eubacterium multiforme]|uniref:Anaerobic selenocysteine-containing dehydrogenase n=1 Tax=Eubacterium multiforme TaxID=83339 RepID=A0ABT9UXG5_9FIRM|nr:molybdopterin-dependent oxidoreductase [Eubacterium multiforme]MDQ0151003.1 anaerobic selenocysteine-containing dehydrogenase [Eubacterium multiforme]
MRKISQGCTLDCFDCCKFNVFVQDNRVIKIEGDKNHPFTKGFICKKGLAHIDRLNHKDRIYKPMIKVKGKWIEISFDEAINIMAEKLNFYKEKYSSKSILYYEQYGNGSVLKSIGDIFFNFFGGVSKQKGGPCWSAGIKAQKYDFGDVRSHSLEDMLNSKNIFVWGKNPAFTSIHTMQMIKKAKDSGSKIIVIDPIYTQTAKFSDLYIRINPDGDSALALAMGKLIIENNLYDYDYINNYVLGFEDYKRYVKSLNLDTLIKKAGISKEKLKTLVNLYTEKYSTILLGYGMQKYKNGGNTIRAIDTLGAITGQIGFSGGGVNYANKVYTSVLNCDPYNSEIYGDNRLFYVSDISHFINDSIKGITYYKDEIYTKNNTKGKSLDIPIKMAVICKSNLLNQLPNLNKLEEAFSKIEFKVCFDMFMTDTAKKCDLFIPTTSTLESEDLLFSSMTNPYIIYNEKAVEPKNKYMDEYYFFIELAKIMNIENYPIVSKREYLEKIIEPLKDYFENISLNKIKEEYLTIHKPVPWEDKKFLTPSGKFEISIYEEDFIDLKENKFRLLTNHSKDTLFSQHMMDKEGLSKAYINESMAKNLGLSNLDIVKLKSQNGTIEVELNIDNSIGDNIVMMYVGWWKKQGNPNFITISDISDIGGQVVYNETFVDIILN